MRVAAVADVANGGHRCMQAQATHDIKQQQTPHTEFRSCVRVEVAVLGFPS